MKRFSLFLPVCAVAMAGCAGLIGAAHASVPVAVTYYDAAGAGFNDASLGPTRRAAFEAAAGYWGSQLSGNVPVRIAAGWASGPSGELAHCTNQRQSRLVDGAPNSSTYYQSSLVGELSGQPFLTNGADFVVTFNTNVTAWYYGAGGNAPGGNYSFYSIALHEICHGLGFSSIILQDGTWSVPSGDIDGPDSFSLDISSNGIPIASQAPGTRAGYLISPNLTFSGTQTNAATGGSGALLYSPPTYEPGVSVSHVSDSYASNPTNPDGLMAAHRSGGPGPNAAGPITLAMLADTGWALVKPPAVNTEPAIGGFTGYTKTLLRCAVNNYWHSCSVQFNVTSDLGESWTIPAGSLAKSGDYQEVSIVFDRAPFDPDYSDRHYTVQAVASSGRGTTTGNTQHFVDEFPGNGTMLKFGGSQQFDASFFSTPTGSQPFTLEAWIFAGAVPLTAQGVALLGSNAAGALEWKYGAPGMIFVGPVGQNPLLAPIPANAWSHIATTWDGVTLRLYVNGVLKGSEPAVFNLAGHTLDFGAPHLGVTDAFIGAIDEVRLWSIARTQSDILRDRTRYLVNFPPELLAEFRLDDASGTSPTDATFHAVTSAITSDAMWAFSTVYPDQIGRPVAAANYATSVGSTSATLNGTVDPMGLDSAVNYYWGTSGLPWQHKTPAVPNLIPAADYATPVSLRVGGLTPGTRYDYGPRAANDSYFQGKTDFGGNSATGYFVTLAPVSGTALQFDGVNSAVRVSGWGQVAPTTDITVEFWAKVNGAVQQSVFVTDPPNSSNIINAHVPWIDGTVYWDFGSEITGGRLTYTPTDNILGAWHHWSMVASNTGHFMKIYRDGVEVASQNSATPFTHSATDWKIGGIATAQFAGQLDEFRVWNVARGQSDIKRDWNRTLSGSEPGLVLYYRMDDGSGPFVTDSSPGAHLGSFVNTPVWVASTAPLVNAYTLPDAVLALRFAAGFWYSFPVDILRLDADGNGSIGVADAVRITRKVAGLDTNP